MSHISLNGKMVPGNEPVMLASNRSYRYGDGLFETIKLVNGQLLLKEYHFDRLFSGLALLRYTLPSLFTREKLEKEILALCRKNECGSMARIRLSVSRGNGGLFDEDRTLQYIIECWPLDETMNQLNENGLIIGVYPGAKKATGEFSNLKSANFLPYSMAAVYAKENKLNDCLVTNVYDKIADSTIANVFIIKNRQISTPPLVDGCINGVMRRHLLIVLSKAGYLVFEKSLLPADLESAEEVFLSNAIRGIRWVGRFGDNVYTNQTTREIYNRFVATIHE